MDDDRKGLIIGEMHEVLISGTVTLLAEIVLLKSHKVHQAG
jgi:hypothetical protein